MQQVNLENLCQEICFNFESSTKLVERDYLFKRVIEYKCELDIQNFSELFINMTKNGFKISQIQKDASENKCFVWFEEEVDGV
tara:strand:- start:439 stop:687 length:249 start_codon:yes stop_codon:yes gene_type:complete